MLHYGKEKIVKRIYGVYGDYVEITTEGVYINEILIIDNFENYNETEYTLLLNEYFVLGDNFSESTDSRYFGAIDKNQIIGKVIFP